MVVEIEVSTAGLQVLTKVLGLWLHDNLDEMMDAEQISQRTKAGIQEVAGLTRELTRIIPIVALDESQKKEAETIVNSIIGG